MVVYTGFRVRARNDSYQLTTLNEIIITLSLYRTHENYITMHQEEHLTLCKQNAATGFHIVLRFNIENGLGAKNKPTRDK